jgi:protein arginine kinase activator
MHKGTRHVGKAPAGLRQTREVSERLASLQRQLTKAVQEENFEQAARFRDQIKELNTSVPPTAAPSAG